MTQSLPIEHFADLHLPEPVLRAIQGVGYETPTPIQQRTIPPLLQGKDLLGHAPTGTGKTAAFALPILARMDLDAKGVQALILAPTRELAIQVAEAFAKYATHMKRLRVLPIYGGQDYSGQTRQLSRGVNVVVGTPGRIMDHMRRGTLTLNNLKTLVLDEADEMLRMGFIDDVEWILEQTPDSRQMALFSATMPSVIRRIASKHLSDPVEITIEGRMTTAATIRQRFWLVSGLHKLDALTRLLEAEEFDAMLVFVRTRTATAELADKLTARGFSAAAMNGDMPQKQREQMVEKLKRGQLDILVATDVVARGLDVKRISHVINYDIPYDTEAYVHRIGRTGRAGRTGDAILFVTQRERRLLGAIEKATRQKIEALVLPTIEMVNNKRIADFKQRISDTLATGELAYLQRMIEEFCQDHDVPAERVGAALVKMCMGEQPLLLTGKTGNERARMRKDANQVPGKTPFDKPARRQVSQPSAIETSARADSRKGAIPAATQSRIIASHQDTNLDTTAADKQLHNQGKQKQSSPTTEKTIAIDKQIKSQSRAQRRQAEQAADFEMERFRVEVGKEHGVKTENLVGAIANEAGLDAEFIGRVIINDNHSLVELPAGMPKFLLKDLKRVWVCDHRLNISRCSDSTQSVAKAAVSAGQAKRNPKTTAPRKTRNVALAGDADLANAREMPANHGDEKQSGRKKERHRDKKNKGKRKQKM